MFFLAGRRIITVFLDRDGTLNVKAPEGEYIRTPEDLIPLPGALESVARLNKAGLQVILVTNQRWLSEPGTSTADYDAVHERLLKLLANHDAHLDAAYHCPHAAASCDCRKPLPGLLLRAATDLDIDLGAAVMIGDQPSDIAAGHTAGTATVLLRPGVPSHPAVDLVVPDLPHAVNLLLA